MRLALACAIIITIILAVAYLTTAWRSYRRKRLIDGLEDPVLWLPDEERQEHARKLLAREQEQYDLQRQQDLMDAINGNKIGRKIR